MKIASRSLLLPRLLIVYMSLSFASRDRPTLAQSNSDPHRSAALLELIEIDNDVIKEFTRAWHIAGGGVETREGVVLIYRKPDGTTIARSQNCTNEHKRFTFKWSP